MLIHGTADNTASALPLLLLKNLFSQLLPCSPAVMKGLQNACMQLMINRAGKGGCFILPHSPSSTLEMKENIPHKKYALLGGFTQRPIPMTSDLRPWACYQPHFLVSSGLYHPLCVSNCTHEKNHSQTILFRLSQI